MTYLYSQATKKKMSIATNCIFHRNTTKNVNFAKIETIEGNK